MPALKPESASRTALGTAYLRAAHQVLDASPHVLEDPFAVAVLGTGALQRINDDAEQYQTPERRLLRAHLVLRARYTEDRLAAAVNRGVTQYVVLGAGFDTFALRQPAWAHRLRILELDHPATQALKRSYLAASDLVLPENTALAGIDLRYDSLHDRMHEHGFSLEIPTFFSCLGVIMYLEETVLDTMFRSITAFPAGTEITFTFAQPSDGTLSPFARRAATLGEPWVSYFEPDALAAKLRHAGFTNIEFLTTVAARARYFNDRPQDLTIPKRISLATAIR